MAAAEISTLGRLACSPVIAYSLSVGVPVLPAEVDTRLNFSSFSKGIMEGKADSNQTRGELSRRIGRVRTSRISVAPQLEIQPTALELVPLLDLTLGAAPSGTSYTLGNGTRRFQLKYDDQTTVWAFPEVAMSRLSLRSSDTDPTLHASCSLIAKNCVSGSTWPSGLASSAVDETTQPFIHQDTSTGATPPQTSTVSVGGTAIWTPNIEIDIDNGLLQDRFFNSLYLTEFVKPDRHITLRLTYPFGEFPSLYTAAAADAGVAVTVTYTNGNTSLLFTFANVQFPKEPVAIPMRGEVMHQITGNCYRTSGAEALVITFDSTP